MHAACEPRNQAHVKGSFGGRGPLQCKSLRTDAAGFHHFAHEVHRQNGIVITDLVMAFPEVSPARENSVGPGEEGFNNENRVDSAGTHYANRPDVWRILQA